MTRDRILYILRFLHFAENYLYYMERTTYEIHLSPSGNKHK